jgi:hypothetical protein
MRKVLLLASLAGFAVLPAAALADTIVIEPEVDAWVLEQSGPDVTFDGDVVIGATLPDTVEIVAVPDYDAYSYVVVNKRRVLVDRKTRTVVKVYD